ncbi:hypothetical protein AB664_26255 [Brucella anthropi]|uniref:Uncharacterized protein n=1 Tax=Brucella anthropi TaxID=529 RepID=A0A656Z6K2_BRUAN|nr:hypothetical protein AB664_26255 [Brucella anthropi]
MEGVRPKIGKQMDSDPMHPPLRKTEHTQISIDERNTFFRKSKVRCGINFADDRGPQFVRSTVYDKQNDKQVFS